MTEQVPPHAADDVDPDLVGADRHDHDVSAPEAPLQTGVPAVDEVLARVDRLHHAPLDEHLAAYEHAHESLRSALDADPGDPA